jgi:hypothetical protein
LITGSGLDQIGIGADASSIEAVSRQRAHRNAHDPIQPRADQPPLHARAISSSHRPLLPRAGLDAKENPPMNQALARLRLHLAYRNTLYRVRSQEGAFDLKIDLASEELARLHLRHRVQASAFLTAYNPQSRPTPDARNRAMQAALLQRIARSGWPSVPGAGIDPSGAWPEEESLLILGLPFATACAIARELDQAAFLYAGADAVARLVDPLSARHCP